MARVPRDQLFDAEGARRPFESALQGRKAGPSPRWARNWA